MSRSVNDPCIVEVMAVVDRMVASPEYARNPSLPGSTLAKVLDIDDLERFVEWPLDAIRTMLLTYLQWCPDDELLNDLDVARKEVRWIEHYEVMAAYERATGLPYPGPNSEYDAPFEART